MVETHPEKRLIGYARVSTVGQTLDSQLAAERGHRRRAQSATLDELARSSNVGISTIRHTARAAYGHARNLLSRSPGGDPFSLRFRGIRSGCESRRVLE